MASSAKEPTPAGSTQTFTNFFFGKYAQTCCAPVNMNHRHNDGVLVSRRGKRKLNAEITCHSERSRGIPLKHLKNNATGSFDFAQDDGM
jgi:hypothetical protein